MHSTVVKSKWFVLFSALILASLVLSACGSAAGGGKMKTSVGDGEGELLLVK